MIKQIFENLSASSKDGALKWEMAHADWRDTGELIKEIAKALKKIGAAPTRNELSDLREMDHDEHEDILSEVGARFKGRAVVIPYPPAEDDDITAAYICSRVPTVEEYKEMLYSDSYGAEWLEDMEDQQESGGLFKCLTISQILQRALDLK